MIDPSVPRPEPSESLETGHGPERAILVALFREGVGEASLDELAALAEAAGALVVGRLVQRRDAPESGTFIGSGKLREAAQAVLALSADLLVVDDELTGSQIRNLEKGVGCRVIDRTMLILDIFARRAVSREGRLQVELAQLKYRLPRLTGLGTVLSRLGGGIGTRGPGETQLETDRRHLRRRIQSIERELRLVAERRDRVREQRRAGRVVSIAVVGYTNAGKSTLVNRLCGSDLLVLDQVFATLDPSVRRLPGDSPTPVVLVDTVGFIRRLPHTLVEAFQSTLEEATQADAILEILDAADPEADAMAETVESVLQSLGAAGKPRFVVLNKTDLLDPAGASGWMASLPRRTGDRVFEVSALTGAGAEALRNALLEWADRTGPVRTYRIPHRQAGLVSWIHRHGREVSVRYEDDAVSVSAALTPEDTRELARLLASAEPDGYNELKSEDFDNQTS